MGKSLIFSVKSMKYPYAQYRVFIKTNVYIFQIFKDRHPYYLYRDQAYKSLAYIFGPYPGQSLITGNKQYINKELSHIQMSVKHLFGLNHNL